MLELSGINAFYGQSQALFGMSLSVEAGQVVSLMGRNGMGKTTTIRTIMGLMEPRGGELSFQGQSLPRGLTFIVLHGAFHSSEPASKADPPWIGPLFNRSLEVAAVLILKMATAILV